MRNDGLSRLKYFDGQFLRAQDFTDEQAYHLVNRWRHNISHHSYGIAVGLELTQEEGEVYLAPGVAIDGYGRELIVTQRQRLRIRETMNERGFDGLDVWLTYQQQSAQSAPNGYVGCREQERELTCADDPASCYRWTETPRISLERVDTDRNDRFELPAVVPDSDANFGAYRAFPLDDAPWPVYLGTVRPATPPNQESPFAIDVTDRLYVDLVGARIEHPSGRHWIDLGAEMFPDSGFAIHVNDNPDAPLAPRLQIQNGGPVTIRGETTLHGDLTINLGAIRFTSEGACVDAPRVWGAYRCQVPPQSINPSKSTDPCAPSGQASQGRQLAPCGQTNQANQAGQVGQYAPGKESQSGAQGSSGTSELRIQMGRKNGLLDRRIVLGKWNPQGGNFEPCLTIADDCSVTVHGDLVVQGTPNLCQGVKPAPPSPELQAALASIVLSGLNASLPLLSPQSQPGTSGPANLVEFILTHLNAIKSSIPVINESQDLDLLSRDLGSIIESNEELKKRLQAQICPPPQPATPK